MRAVPELPDITVYVEAIATRVLGTHLARIRLASPFVLRTVRPGARDIEGRRVVGVERMAKRIVLTLEPRAWIVVHLMKSGRLRWTDFAPGAPPPPIPKKLGLAAFDFERGSLLLTEAGTKRRAALHFLDREEDLRALDRGGLEVADLDPNAFAERLTNENHTLKRALTDPRIFAGIGNAYSDEILHRAKLSPVRLTSQLDAAEVERLRCAIVETMAEWVERLREELDVPRRFPEKVTAFRDGMRVHGRYGAPCPVCGHPVQRIVYAESETNYCAMCQTGGKLLADRSLSRLLHDDWPRSLEELEERRDAARGAVPTPRASITTAASTISGDGDDAPARARARRSPRSR